jgi:cytochrome c oxidase subunit II
MTMSCAPPGRPASLIALLVLRLLQSCAARFRLGRYAAWGMTLTGALIVTGCGGVQSTLNPAGREAERIAVLFWWMTCSAVVIWLAVIALTIYAARAWSEARNQRRDRFLIIGGGAVIPTVVLTVLLVYGLAPIPVLLAPAPEGSLRIIVSGEQWWWRVRYFPPGGQAFELANEIRLPVGEPVQFQLDSPDVIHSFWIPSLAGKMDMIPGRVTYLAVQPTKTGVFRGACAEYCGTSHAMMNFYVEVMKKEDFSAWLVQQAQPSQPSAESLALSGQELFLRNGCNACHTVRGTRARGLIGPDLTHVGSRLSLAAGTLPNEPDAFQRWIAHTTEVKPAANMPAFHMLPPEELRALAAYLEGLK